MINQELFDTRPRVKKRLNPLPPNPEKNHQGIVKLGRFPSWLHRSLPKGTSFSTTDKVMKTHGLNTVCVEASCPNQLECWSKKTATFLIMGKSCTRACGFCDIDFSKNPPPLEKDEPKRIAQSVKELGLKHVVITQVARDDLLDGGASHIVKVVEEIRKVSNEVTIELLTSDLEGKESSLDTVLAIQPDIFNHNIETTRRLTPKVRHKATYDRTLKVLSYVKNKGKASFVKSGLMLGLGESDQEVHQTLKDLKQAGCDIVTLGQYLQPNRHKLRVKSFIHPNEFSSYQKYGHSLGIAHVYAGPFVRSSYNAEKVMEEAKKKRVL